MKKLCTLTFFVAVLMFSCNDDDDNGIQMVQFKADFFTELTAAQVAKTCNAPYSALNIQVGAGSLEGFGNFTTQITFCVDGDPTSPTFLEYINSEGSFLFSNGDRLDFTGFGKVILIENDPNGYEAMFTDPFTFIGGTGRFEGATGDGMTDSYVNFLPGGGDRTDHIWEGELLLK